jgi:fluoride ion exporter CrcB/FEX
MRSIFYVGAGSFVGGILRYLLSTCIYRISGIRCFHTAHWRSTAWGVLLSGLLQVWQKLGRFSLQMIVFLFLSASWEDSQPYRPWRRKLCGSQGAPRAWPR